MDIRSTTRRSLARDLLELADALQGAISLASDLGYKRVASSEDIAAHVDQPIGAANVWHIFSRKNENFRKSPIMRLVSKCGPFSSSTIILLVVGTVIFLSISVVSICGSSSSWFIFCAPIGVSMVLTALLFQEHAIDEHPGLAIAS